jgi:hypothetical protein
MNTSFPVRTDGTFTVDALAALYDGTPLVDSPQT